MMQKTKRREPSPFQRLSTETRPLVLVLPGLPPFPIQRANTFWRRFAGLMGRRESAYGLWILPCDAIHMLFMRFSLDAVFLDQNGTVVAIRTGVKPWGMAFGGKGAHSVLELPASRNLARSLAPGMSVPLTVAGPADGGRTN